MNSWGEGVGGGGRLEFVASFQCRNPILQIHHQITQPTLTLSVFRPQSPATHAAVVARPVDHRLVVRRVAGQGERGAGQSQLLHPEAGGSVRVPLRPRLRLPSVPRRSSGAAARALSRVRLLPIRSTPSPPAGACSDRPGRPGVRDPLQSQRSVSGGHSEEGARKEGRGRGRSPAPRPLVEGAPWGRHPAWARAGAQLGAAGAAAAGARGAEDQEPRAREERAQPGAGAAAGANFSHRGAEGGGRRGSRSAGGGAGSPRADGETGAQDPNSIQVGQRRGGRRRRRVGGERPPRLGWSRARVRTERAAAAAATRGWSRTEVAGGAGGAGAGGRATREAGRAGAAGAPGAASRSRAALRAGGCGDWMRRRPSPWAHWRRRRPLLPASRSEPARPAGLPGESARASRGGGQLGAGGAVTVRGILPALLLRSDSAAFPPPSPRRAFPLYKRGICMSPSWSPRVGILTSPPAESVPRPRADPRKATAESDVMIGGAGAGEDSPPLAAQIPFLTSEGPRCLGAPSPCVLWLP